MRRYDQQNRGFPPIRGPASGNKHRHKMRITIRRIAVFYLSIGLKNSRAFLSRPLRFIFFFSRHDSAGSFRVPSLWSLFLAPRL
jgi:hypothetical protein